MSDESQPLPEDSIALSLKSMSDNPRGRERVIEVEFRNSTLEPLDLLSLDKFLQPGVRLSKSQASSFAIAEEKYNGLCKDLEVLLNHEFSFTTEGVLEERKKRFSALADEVLGRTFLVKIPGLLKRYFLAGITGSFIDGHFDEWYTASLLTVQDYRDAQAAYDALPPVNEEIQGSAYRGLLQLKLSQLKELEETRTVPGVGSGGIRIDPEGSYSERVILTFPQAFIESRSFTVSYTARVRMQNGSNTSRETPCLVTIAPNPTVQSVLAAIFAIAGLASRYVIEQKSPSTATAAPSLLEYLMKPTTLVPVCVAFLIFNLYDNLDLSMAKKLAPTWRSAALIGYVCGLGTDNFLKALEGFFGIK